MEQKQEETIDNDKQEGVVEQDGHVPKGSWTQLQGDMAVADMMKKVDDRDQALRDKQYEKERAQSKWIRALEKEKE